MTATHEIVEYVDTKTFANQVALILRENMPGGIYVETGDDPNQIFVISRGANTAGVFALTVATAEIAVA